MNLKKLRTMSLDEVGHRLKAAGARKLHQLARDRHREAFAPAQFLPGFLLHSDFDGPFSDAITREHWPAAEEYLLQHMRARTTGHGFHETSPKFFFTPAERPEILQIYTTALNGRGAAGLALAHRCLERRFAHFGVEIRFPGEVDWLRDPVSGRRWPLRFYTDMRYYGPAGSEEDRPDDVKYVWELNRHQHFVVLGKAYWLTGDEKYAAELLAQWSGWLEQNPYLWGVNWTSALEVGMRSLAWLWAYFFCLESSSLTPTLHARLLRALQLHGRYLRRHLSFFTSPYNHLIGEATALFHLGVLFPEFKEAAAWRRTGWKILCAEVTRQFHADGACVEQAISYHHFTLGLYLQALQLARRNGHALPQELCQRFERALEFSLATVQPDGRHPMIGDNDDARAFFFGERATWDFRDYLALGAVLHQRGDFKALAGHYDEACLWLLGPESETAFAHLPAGLPPVTSRFFTASGYAVMRSGWQRHDHYLIFDCGPQSHGLFPDDNVSTAHGHADALAFQLHVHGRPFLIDAGMLTYNGDLTWQNYFRSGTAHNTLTVDQRSACRVVGRLGYSHVPEVQQTFHALQPGFDFVEASYRSSDWEVRHCRALFHPRHEYWLIVDTLEGEGGHTTDRWLHFAAEVRLRAEGTQLFAGWGEDQEVLVQEVGPARGVLEVFHGGASPEQGWIAPGYGIKMPAPVVRLRAQASLPLRFALLLAPVHRQEPLLQATWLEGAPGASIHGFRVTAAGWEDWVAVNPSGEWQQLQELETDARVAHVRREVGSGKLSAAMAAGTALRWQGATLLPAHSGNVAGTRS